MDPKQLLVLGASVLASSLGGRAVADEAQDTYVRVAEIEVDPVQLEVYKAAAKEVIEDSVRQSPEFWLCIRCPTRIIRPMSPCSRCTRTGTRIRLISKRLISKYKITTQDMVRSLKLRDTVPIALSAKAK